MSCVASWAFVGLHLMSRPTGLDRTEAALLGAAHLLGLLVEKAQMRRESLEEKARRAEDELRRLRLIRAEDAKANEKVVSIFSSHEQSWIAEKKSLRLQIRALTSHLESLTAKNENALSSLNFRITEAEFEMRAKDEALEAEIEKTRDLEEKLQAARQEEQDRSCELQRQKDAFAELEAEMARALEQAQATRKEADEVLERKEEAVMMAEKLSDKIAKMQDDAEHKDKILSALLRKSKLDAAEKQMLLKEVKISKAKKKLAELEADKWKNKWESRNKKGPRSSFSVEAGCSEEQMEDLQAKRGAGLSTKTLLLDYFESEWGKEREFSEKDNIVVAAVKRLDQYATEEIGDELATHDVGDLRDWVRLETQKYACMLEQKHFAEIEAFTEQMRLKDEKLEAFRWRLLSKDIESKRLHSQIEALEESISQLREKNFKLRALLLDREGEIKSLKDQFGFFIHQCRRNTPRYSPTTSCEGRIEISSGTSKRIDTEHDIDIDECDAVNKELEVATTTDNDNIAMNLTDSPQSSDCSADNSTIYVNEIFSDEAISIDSYEDQAKSIPSVSHSPVQEIEDKEVVIDPAHASLHNNSKKEASTVGKIAPVAQSVTRKESNSWKMDIQALGVSYKIKRLKQQLIMLEKLAGMGQTMTGGDANNGPENKKVGDNKEHLKGIMLLVHLLSKQVKRFQSLEEKTNNLCTRMHESTRDRDRSDSQDQKEQCRVLEIFLEETFQLQRYMVATGQKLMDIQSKITSSTSISSSDGLNESAGFNMGQFADVIRSLFGEIQRGLEVRIARIIGDLEGTLACDGMRRI